jgi:outer membrane murein-binding lipoprotein Lpp
MLKSEIRTGYGRLTLGLLISAAGALSGCGSPSAANIELRKQNQTLQTQVDQLTAQHTRDVETLAACQRSHPTLPTLPPQILEKLVTTHGLTFGRLTGGDNPDPAATSDNQLKIYIVPIDGDGIPIKAAGAFKVEAFDLGDPTKPLIGTWNFDISQTDRLFYSQFALYTYVLPCAFVKLPAHTKLTVKVTFDDALTGREFVNQTETTVRVVNPSH